MHMKDNQVPMKVVNRVENRAPPSNTPPSILDCYVFKTLLEQYFQKEGIRYLVYETINEGTEHEPSFRSTVIINNVRYDSLPGFSEPLDAEHSAAEVALIVLANSPDTRSRLSQIMFTSGVGKNRLELYCRKMNYAPPKYECYGEPGNFCSFVTVGDIKYAGSSGSTENESDISACRTALTAIEAAAQASEDNIRNSIFTVVPQRNKISNSGYSTQSRQGPIKTDCLSQGTTAETIEPERISTKMNFLFQDTAMLKYPFKDELSQNTTVAALEPNKGLVEIGCFSIGTTGTGLDGMVDCSFRGTTAGGLKPQENLANKEDNTDAIDSGVGVVSISTQESHAAQMLTKSQRRRMTRIRSKARKMQGDVSMPKMANNLKISNATQTRVVGVDAIEKPNPKNRQRVNPALKTDGRAALESPTVEINCLKVGPSENIQAAIGTSANSSFSDQGISARQNVREPEPQTCPVKMDYFSQGTANAGFEVKMDCSSQGTTVKALEQKNLVESNFLSKDKTNAKAAGGGIINQENAACGSSNVNIEDNKAAIDSDMGAVSTSTQETDAAVKLSKGQIKRMRQKRNRAIRKEGALSVVNVNGQAAVESKTTEPVLYQMTNNLEMYKVRQTGVIGTDTISKPNPRKKQKRNSILNTNSSTVGI